MLREGVAVGIVKADVVIAVKGQKVKVRPLSVSADQIGFGIICQHCILAIYSKFGIFSLN